MDGDNGFCSDILGTPEYRASLAAMLPILKESRCHTLDRDNMLAHKDVCGVGVTPAWEEAVDQQYRMNNWQFVNAKTQIANCFASTLSDSLINMSKDGAYTLAAMSVAFVSVFEML